MKSRSNSTRKSLNSYLSVEQVVVMIRTLWHLNETGAVLFYKYYLVAVIKL